MMTVLWILGVLSMAQAESPLSLDAVSSLEDGESVVIARLRNRSPEPCVVVLNQFFCRAETRLYDGKGKELRPHDQRSARGRARTPERVVRICAARALGAIAAAETREALAVAAQDDEDSLVRSSPEDALKKLPR